MPTLGGGISRLPCCVFLLDLYIYTAGGGNPLYRAELLKQCSRGKNRATEPIFFAELAFFMHKGDVEVKVGDQTLLKHLFFKGFISFLHLLRNIWGISPICCATNGEFSPFVAQQIKPAHHIQLLLNSIWSMYISGYTRKYQIKIGTHVSKGNINNGFCFTHTCILKNHHFCFFSSDRGNFLPKLLLKKK